MKQIPLTQGKYAIVDDEDFDWLNHWKWCFNGGYAIRRLTSDFGGKTILMHRVVNKTPDGFETDHINRDRLDNRKANLRNATKSENKMNQPKKAGCASRYKGVSWDNRSSKWRARVKLNGKRSHIGLFICEIVAAWRYDEEAQKLFGEFALLNFIQVTTG